MTRRPRLDPAIFNLPVEKMRAGYYSDKYFTRAREILLADGSRPRVMSWSATSTPRIPLLDATAANFAIRLRRTQGAAGPAPAAGETAVPAAARTAVPRK